MTDLFGSGLGWPYQVSASGRLVRTSGSSRVVDTVEQVVMTPRGVCPLDPQYGIDEDVYERVAGSSVSAWALANAVEYAEPRVERIEVVVQQYDPTRELLELRCELTPIGSNVPINRVLNLYELAT